jgi:hypothetical protein
VTIEALSLPPREAIAFFLQKRSVGTRRWDDVWKAAHTRAWMVAGVQAGDLLEGVRRAVQRGIAEGTTLAAFRADLQPLLERLGWAARGEGYVGWRTRVVYETNLRSAYAAGDYEQRTEPEVLEAFPYWRYRHSGARDPRPEHKAWDGLVLRADDPWWQTHHPPNGWGCGCWVEPLTAAELGRLGKPGPDSAPPIVTRVWTDRASGRTERVPVGIDPGWDYNVGAAWRQVRDLPPGTLPPDWPPPAPPPAPAPARMRTERRRAEVAPAVLRADAALAEATADWRRSLVPEERAALAHWRGIGGQALNRIARGDVPATPALAAELARLAAALDRAVLPRAAVVYRGAGAAELAGLGAPGSTGRLMGFAASSLDRLIAEDFARRHGGGVIEIRVRAGTRGAAYLQALRARPRQYELLLAAGLVYRVVSRSKRRLVIEVGDEPG